MDKKDIVDVTKLVKKLAQCLLEWGSDKFLHQDYVWIGKREPENGLLKDKKSWNRKQIGKLLLILTIADSKQFTDKSKSITYIRAFVELYNRRNRRQVHEIYGIVEFGKMHTLMAKYPHNLGAYYIIEISSILCNAYIVPRN